MLPEELPTTAFAVDGESERVHTAASCTTGICQFPENEMTAGPRRELVVFGVTVKVKLPLPWPVGWLILIQDTFVLAAQEQLCTVPLIVTVNVPPLAGIVLLPFVPS